MVEGRLFGARGADLVFCWGVGPTLSLEMGELKVFPENPLRHASCVGRWGSQKHESRLRSARRWLVGRSLGLDAHSGGSFLTRQSFTSATPFVGVVAVVAPSTAASFLASAGRSFLVTLRRGWACGADSSAIAIVN